MDYSKTFTTMGTRHRTTNFRKTQQKTKEMRYTDPTKNIFVTNTFGDIFQGH
jgi:hypothetical protein